MDLRHLLTDFSESGELRSIATSVDLDQEYAALCRREFAAGDGRALLFEQLRGCEFRSAGNLFGSEARMARILRSSSLAQFSERLAGIFGRHRGEAAERLRNLATAAGDPQRLVPPLWQHQPGATLLELPAICSWPKEARPYWTLPLVISRDPHSGEQNLGLYRIQVIDQQHAAINIQPGSGAGQHLAKAAQLQQALPVALVFGADLALSWLAAATLPPGCDEYRLFTQLFAEALPLAAGLTQDFNLPGEAEFVIEGTITPGDTCQEGPFGNHSGCYVGRTDCPVFTMTSLAWREQPIMPLTVVGPPPSENIFLAKANEILLRTMLQVDFPQIIDLKMPELTIFHGVTLLKVGRLGHREVADLIAALWSRSLLKNSKLLIVLDADVDLENYGQAYWRLINQFDSRRIYHQGKQTAIDATGVDPKLLVVEDSATVQLLASRQADYYR